MSLFSFWPRRNETARPRCRRPATTGLGLEVLEARTTPSAIGTATQNFVDQVYRDVLHRAPDAGGLEGWRLAIDTGRLSRLEVVLQIKGSPEGIRTQVN